MLDLNENAHTRFNILTGEWILVSPHRTKRPWQGKLEEIPIANRPMYDPGCYLCPGNVRADGEMNPVYEGPFVFTNDFAALLPNIPKSSIDINGLLMARSASGTCRVISFSPDHSLTLSKLSIQNIMQVIDLWSEEFRNISNNPEILYIQIFENKGEIMGCSNPHPHGQIWAQNSLPTEIQKETFTQKEYFHKNGTTLLSDYLTLELEKGDRIVIENEYFVALVPFWAVWPYETMIISKRPIQNITLLSLQERLAYALIMKDLASRYDLLFNVSFPYSAGIHQAPVNCGDHPEWHFHMHFYPPLLRSASIKKFMVGYEMLANPQRDITPEAAADRLRNILI